VNDLAKKGISIATPHLQERLAGLKTIAELVSLDPFRGWVMAMVATYGLRNHEIWHVNASNAEPMSGWVRTSSCRAPLQVMLCLRAKASTRSKVSLFMAMVFLWLPIRWRSGRGLSWAGVMGRSSGNGWC
jgi:hypothetical protein